YLRSIYRQNWLTRPEVPGMRRAGLACVTSARTSSGRSPTSKRTGSIDGWLRRPGWGRHAWSVLSVSAALLVGHADTVWPGLGVWTATGPEGGSVTAVAIDPTRPLTVYTGTDGSGIFKSANGGTSWTVLAFPSTASVRAVVIDPANPAAIYAVTDGNY